MRWNLSRVTAGWQRRRGAHDVERPEWKQKALQDFARWLDDLPEDEPDSHGQEPDSFGLIDLADAITTLRAETAALARNAAKIIRDNEELQQQAAEEREQTAHTIATIHKQIRTEHAERDRAAQAECLINLFDMSEDIRHVVQRCEQWKPARKRWLVTERLPPDLLGDMRLLLEQAEQTLFSRGVRCVARVGEPFDPHTMRAVNTTSEGNVGPGCVSEIVTQGVAFGGQLLREARVNVEQESERPESGQEQVETKESEI